MDANTMFARFNLGFEASRLFNRTFNEREVQDFLNKAQLELIKQRFAAFRNVKQIGINNKTVPQAYEVRNSELAGLLTGTASIPASEMIQGTIDNGGFYGPDLDNSTEDGAYKTGTTDPNTANFGAFVPIPNEALYILAESLDTRMDNSPNGYIYKNNVPVLQLSYNEYVSGIRDFYAKPYKNLAWSVDWGSYTTSTVSNGLFADSTKDYSTTGSEVNMTGNSYDTTVTTPVNINTNRSKYLIPGKDWRIVRYKCNYLKAPAEIEIDLITPTNQVNCELPDYMHQEIVDLAVTLASASIVPEQGKYQVNQNESTKDE